MSFIEAMQFFACTNKGVEQYGFFVDILSRTGRSIVHIVRMVEYGIYC